MKNQTLRTVIIAAIVALVVVVGFRLVGNQSAEQTTDPSFGAIGITRYPNSGISARGLRASTSTSPSTPADGALEVTGSASLSGTLTVAGATTQTGSITIGASGTALSNYRCNTATVGTSTSLGWDTPNKAATSTDITLTSSVVGDLCWGTLTSATSTLLLTRCNIAANGTGTLQVVNLTGATTTIGSGTGKVCYFH